jgi:hypothetical protein
MPNDPLLLPFLRAADAHEAQRCVEELIERQARPIVRDIVQRKVRRRAGWGDVIDAAEDVEADVVAQLIARLRDLRAGHDAEPIADFASYAAVAAYHGCHRYVRALYPRRARLKNRIRYLLARHETFAIWPGTRATQLCGRRGWQGRDEEEPEAAARLREIRDRPDTLDDVIAVIAREHGASLDEASLVTVILAHVAGPIDLDDLCAVVAARLGIRDTPPPAPSGRGRAGDEEYDPDWESRIADPQPSVVTSLVDGERLRRLWQELLQLPVRQRAALLLNLRDAEGQGMIATLPLSGVATMREIAAALEMPAVEFAALWRELPLEDRRIAEMLALTRQQVINLRKCARERLARRLRGT